MKGVVETIGDIDNPTSSLVSTQSGQEIDLQNLPGIVKLRLIAQGEMEMDQFVAPANMTGRKLKELREAHRARMEAQIKELTGGKEDEFKVGEIVEFNGGSYEVLKTRSNAVLIERKVADTVKKVWVPLSKVEKG